jgi:DNA-binding winged helix-turn-helix (wHTH) protein/tetratricopeptide (TPR) repeat protein
MSASAGQKTGQVYAFGPFRLDAERALLLREGETVSIAPKALQILMVLIRHNKEVVTKDDLMKAVWPDTFVEEANLSRNIFLLRKALGEGPQDHEYIVTVPRRGYRFAADVQIVPGGNVNGVAASDSKVKAQAERTVPLLWIAAAVLLVVVASVGTFKLLVQRAPPLAERRSVVLADFANSTDDPVFDGTLRQGLAVQLEQSPFLSLIADERVQQTLRLMVKPADARLTPEIAEEICERAGSALTLEGSIASLGRQYVVGLKAVNCRNGEIFDEEQVEATRKEDVLAALSTIASNFRIRVGESLDTIRQHDTPLELATTPSLEALQNYSAGISIMKREQFRAAIPLFERAIAIDPKFAMAYYVLGVAYEQVGDMTRSAEYAKQAFSFRNRVSEPERIDVTAYYYRFTGEWGKEIAAWQLAADNFPNSWASHNQLALTYIDLGQFEEGLKEGLEAARLEPNVAPPYRRQLDAYMCLDRLTEAKALEGKVRALGIDDSRIHQRFLELAYLEDDRAAVTRETRWFAGKPEEYLSFGLQAANLNMHGQRRDSHEEYQFAADTARRQGLQYVAEDFEEADARADAFSGNCQTALRIGRPALALAICGDATDAEKLAAETSRRYPNGTIWNAVQLPEIEAVVALQRDEPAKGIELLESASPYERAYPDVMYVRGLVYLKMNRGADAAAEFRKIADHEGASWGATWVHPNWGQYYALSWLGMARGYALEGDTVKAKKAFERFFALWRDADPDVSVLMRARAEYAKLQPNRLATSN